MKFLLKLAFLDAATPWQLGFQDPATPIIIGIIHFHNHLIFFLVAIGTFVIWLLYRALVLFKEDPSITTSYFSHNTALEVVWTITPALVLLLIAGPSFALLEVGKSVSYGFSSGVDCWSAICIVFNLQKRLKDIYASYKANSHYYNYVGAFLLLYGLSLSWGFVFSESLPKLTMGIFFSGISFLLVFQITYPKGLKEYKESPYSFLRFKQETWTKVLPWFQNVFIGLLKGCALSLLFCAYYALYFNFFYIAEYVFALVFIVTISLVTLVLSFRTILLDKVMGVKILFKNKVVRENRKIFLFFRKYPPKSHFLVGYLGGLAIFSSTLMVYMPFVLWSARFHNGQEVYFVFLVVSLTAFTTTLPKFRHFFLLRYGKNSLHMLGWNGIESVLARNIAYGMGGLGLAVTTSLTLGKLNRYEQAQDLEQKRRVVNFINLENEKARLRDPRGAGEGRYPHMGITDPLPSDLAGKPLFAHNVKDIIEWLKKKK